MAGTFVGSLQNMLETKMTQGHKTAAAITARGHTTCIYKPRASTEWYIFDSLDGQLSRVSGSADSVYTAFLMQRHLDACSTAQWEIPFTAMIFGA